MFQRNLGAHLLQARLVFDNVQHELQRRSIKPFPPKNGRKKIGETLKKKTGRSALGSS